MKGPEIRAGKEIEMREPYFIEEPCPSKKGDDLLFMAQAACRNLFYALVTHREESPLNSFEQEWLWDATKYLERYARIDPQFRLENPTGLEYPPWTTGKS